jgi:hypothetical protein
MQNLIFLAVKNNNYEELIELVNVVNNVDVQSEIYDIKPTSMLEQAFKNKNVKIINVLLNHIKELNTMLYNDTIRDLLIKLNNDDISDKVESKLPEWY